MQFQTRFFIGYWIITGVDFNPAPFFLNNLFKSPLSKKLFLGSKLPSIPLFSTEREHIFGNYSIRFLLRHIRPEAVKM